MSNDFDQAAFEEGFEQAYRAVMGGGVPLPAPPKRWKTLAGRTALQTGILAGIEAALGRSIKHY